MLSTIADFILFVGGMLSMGFILLPFYMRSWEQGYKDAQKIYSDWDMGFEQGFYSGAQEILKRIEEGKYDQVNRD